jgi:hypothetical protein
MKAILGHRYRHYKGNEYIVLHIARHSETLEEMVIYEAQYNTPDFGTKALWVRPRAMFEEEIKVDGKLIDRFSNIS